MQIIEIEFPEELKSESIIKLSNKILINSNHSSCHDLANSINILSFSGEISSVNT